jgi:hypothetical protein
MNFFCFLLYHSFTHYVPDARDIYNAKKKKNVTKRLGPTGLYSTPSIVKSSTAFSTPSMPSGSGSFSASFSSSSSFSSASISFSLPSSTSSCYNTVRTPTLCKPDTSDRPYLFSFNLLNLATPLLSYAVRLVLLILVLLSSLLCYLHDAVLILTSDILYSLIDMFLSILRYISTHVFVVEP